MATFTINQIRERAIAWGLDPDDDEDLYIAEESLYCDAGGVVVDALNDGVI